jgi:signal transduction histidine kinase/ligand-binding sensor domain-containing protein
MRYALIWLVFLCEAVSAWAVGPNVRISQYRHTAWRIQDGFFAGSPGNIAQTGDGYLWIGTASGLLRFDGIRFVPWTPPPGKQLPSIGITALLAARDGSLWIGTRSGLSHWVNQDMVNYLSGAVISPFAEDEDGTVWVLRRLEAGTVGPLCRVKGMAVQCYGKADGLPEDVYFSYARDSEGNSWLAGRTSITRWRPGSSQTYYISALKSNADSGPSSLAPSSDGSLWVGVTGSGPGLGFQQFSHGLWKPFVVPGFDSSTLPVDRLLVDRQNTLWVGTFGHGLYRIYGREVDHFGSSDGLSSDVVFGLFEDREGNLWVATNKGIDCFRDLQITTFSTREGLTSPAVSTVQAMRDGSIWIGGAYALNILGPGLDQGGVRSLQEGKGFPGNQVTSLFEDHAGHHWVGIENTLNIYDNGKFKRITRGNGSPTGMILGITEDVDKNLWALSLGPPRMLIRIFDRKVQEEIPTTKIPVATSIVADPRSGIWLGLLSGDLARYQQGRLETFHYEHTPNSRVNQLLVDNDGSVLGATAFGLIGWSNGKQQTLRSRNGLPCDGVNGLVEDDSGALWLYMQCGLVEITRSDLQRWWTQPDVTLHPSVFDVFDGFQGGKYSPFESQAVRTQDGQLWFANGTVAQMIDPARLSRNLIPPPVHVEQIIADRKGYSPHGDVRLPARSRDVEIDYTALSLAVPQKVRFRYKLEGRDTDWQEPGTRRQAFYTDLGPGKYRFRVIACNNSGVWNERGAAQEFSVLPAFYQTNWFRSLCAVGFLALLWGIYQLRVQQLQRQLNIGLEARVNERTRIARELHDTLLQNFHGLMFQVQAASNLMLRRPDEAKRSLDDAINETKKALAESREAIQELRSGPIAKGNLAELLMSTSRELADANGSEDQPVFDLIEEGERRTLSPVVSNDISRIALELMRNAYQHARAHRIEAEIRYGDSMFRLRIRDDGKGIEPNVRKEGGRVGHWGLRGIRERADRIGARLEVWSELGNGTEVQLLVPAPIAYERLRDGYRAKLLRKVKSRAERS